MYKISKTLLAIVSLLFIQISNAAPSDDFVIRVQTNFLGATSSDQFNIPTLASLTYKYDVDCNSDSINEAIDVTGDYICDYSSLGGAGIYDIRIKSSAGTGFPRIYFNGVGDKNKILSVEQWGKNKWVSMNSAFEGAIHLSTTASDSPDLSNASSLAEMFKDATSVTPNTINWDTSTITSFTGMFQGATNANPNVSNWNTSLVQRFKYMFDGASSANPDTSLWNSSSVIQMEYMFRNATSANPNLTNWNIENVTSIQGMFEGVTLPTSTYDTVLSTFAIQNVNTGLSFDGGNSKFCAQTAHDILDIDNSWNMTDGGLCDTSDTVNDFVIKVDTTIPVIAGGTSNTEYLIRINPAYNYNYNVDCNNDGTNEATGLVADYTCDFSSFGGAGVYTIRIKDNNGNRRGFSGFGIVGASTDYDQKKIIELIQWGTFKWQSMEQAFLRASNMLITATDVPDFSEVNNMNSMFTFAILANPNTKYWDTSNVENMGSMFKSAWSANPNTSLWDTTTVDNMHSMFRGALNANPSTSNWDTSNVQSMESMFRGATSANPDTSNWDISSVTTMLLMFEGVTLPTIDYDNMLLGFYFQSPPNGLDFSGGNSKYCSTAAQVAHDKLENSSSWTIDDGGLCDASDSANDFVITVKTDNPGTSTDEEFNVTVDSANYTYSYNVDCNNDGINEFLGATSDVTCDYSATGLNLGAGTYTIRIKDAIGDKTGLPRIFFNSDKDKIVTLEQWGTSVWQTTSAMFASTTNLVIYATDVPDLSQVNEMIGMFSQAPLANPITTYWDFFGVDDLTGMFLEATQANPDTRLWDMSTITNMTSLFAGAINANPDTSGWNTSNVEIMTGLFANTIIANPDTSNWNTSSVTTMVSMFQNAASANPNTSNWDITNVTSMTNMFKDVTLAIANYDAILIGFSQQNVKPNVNFNGGNSKYCAQVAHDILDIDNSWAIVDGGLDTNCPGFIEDIFSNGFEDVIIFKSQSAQFVYDFSQVSVNELDQMPLLIAKGINNQHQPTLLIYLRNDLGQLQIRKDYINAESQWIQGLWESIENNKNTLIHLNKARKY